eukprot:TRINITY_DN12576_c0_g1_i2.p1 TRINITY_DN12576_c0_g1~~TRINITY_DN12576_c0_g1_i2.p1  ORF type:complete len:971 (-),score=221.67 TRINITY_DN12576_c0_g1_i2:23-2935(-)
MLGLTEKINTTGKTRNICEFWSSGKVVIEDKISESIKRWKPGQVCGLFYYKTDDNTQIYFMLDGSLSQHYDIKTGTHYYPIINFDGTTQLQCNFGEHNFSFDIRNYCFERKIPLLLTFTDEIEKKSQIYWTIKIVNKIENRFPFCFSSIPSGSDIRELIDKNLLMKLLQKYGGVTFSPKMRYSSQMMMSDIEDLPSRISRLAIIDYAEAVYQLLAYESSPHKDINLLKIAEYKLCGVLSQTNIKHARDYYYWSSMLINLAKKETDEGKVKKYQQKAGEIMSKVENMESQFFWRDNYTLWFQNGLHEIMAKIWMNQGNLACKENEKYAREKFSKALQLVPDVIYESFKSMNAELVYDNPKDQYYNEAKVQFRVCQHTSKEIVEFLLVIFKCCESVLDANIVTEVSKLLTLPPPNSLAEAIESLLTSPTGTQLYVLMKIGVSNSKIQQIIEQELIKKQKIHIKYNILPNFEEKIGSLIRDIQHPKAVKIIEDTIKNYKSISISFDRLSFFPSKYMGKLDNLTAIIYEIPKHLQQMDLYRKQTNILSKFKDFINISLAGICYPKNLLVFTVGKKKLSQLEDSLHVEKRFMIDDPSIVPKLMQKRVSFLEEFATICMNIHKKQYLLVSFSTHNILIDKHWKPTVFNFLSVLKMNSKIPTREKKYLQSQHKDLPPLLNSTIDVKWDLYLYAILCEDVFSKSSYCSPKFKYAIDRCKKLKVTSFEDLFKENIFNEPYLYIGLHGAQLINKPIYDFKNWRFCGDATSGNVDFCLTEDEDNKSGLVIYQQPLELKEELRVSFHLFTLNNNTKLRMTGDGICFFLLGTHPQELPSQFPHKTGATLGYTPDYHSPGLPNAYLGIGFDEMGNFSRKLDLHDGPDKTAPWSICIRGGYNYLDSEHISPWVGVWSHVQIYLKVSRSRKGELELKITNEQMHFVWPRPITLPERVPKKLTLGFSAANGIAVSSHYISNVSINSK